MSTVNEKLTAIADAIRMYTGKAEPLTLDAMEDGVHEGNQATKDHYFTEGIEQGKQEEYDRLVDETKIIEKTVSGSAIRVHDVSEIPHKCTVTANKDTNVTVCGKNLLNLSGRVVAESNGGAITTKRTFTGNQIFVGLTANNYWYSQYVASYAVNATSVTVKSTASGYGIGFDLEVIPENTYTFSCAEPYGLRYAFYQEDGAHISWSEATGSITCKAPNNAKWLVVFCVPQKSNTECTYTNLQVEVGSAATVYEPYQEGGKHSISAGQSFEVDSFCPHMVVSADNDATITFGYHKSYGRQAEYDAFWDAFQENGNRTNYNSAFFYWPDETFQPKYDIVPTGSAISMFSNSKIKNLKDIIEKAGIIFDTSKSTDVGYMFNAASYLTEAPLIDATNSKSVDRLFNQCGSLKKASVVFPENKITAYTNAFQQCVELEDFTAYGVIDFPLSLSTCSKLTNASVQSIIDCLKDLTGATTQTLTVHQNVRNRMTPEQVDTIVNVKNWTLAPAASTS